MEMRNQFSEDLSSAKRALSGEEDQKRREDSIHEDTIFNPSPDDHHHQIHHRPDPDADPTRVIHRPDPTTRYRECRRNHAAHLGTHVVDGCGEFMAADHDANPAAMICAACGCHRNFHQKESSSIIPRELADQPILYRPLPFRQALAAQHWRFSDQALAMVALRDASSEDFDAFRSEGEGGSSRKRFRTKFTEEQKEKMMELSEKIGWRMQKQDESEVQRFCAATGVRRQVFKVWMHNNKQAMKRKQTLGAPKFMGM